MSNAIGMDAVKAGGMSETGRPAIVEQDGTIEALKWLGVVLMTLDHTNKYFFNETLPGVFELGRLTMPIFGFVLAYNLARPGCLAKGAYGRTMKRMALYGLLATPFYMILGAGQLVFGWFPLNIMAMLFVATASLYLVELGGRRAILAAEVVFLLGGILGEFWWIGQAVVMTAWWYFRSGRHIALVSVIVATALLFVINRNFYAVFSIVLLVGAQYANVRIPRLKNIFYAYYPLHLAVLCGIHKIYY